MFCSIITVYRYNGWGDINEIAQIVRKEKNVGISGCKGERNSIYNLE